MQELIAFLQSKKEAGDDVDQICKNLLLITKKNYGKLRVFNLSPTNHKLFFGGTIDERDRIFYADVAKFKDKYDPQMLRRFFDYWSEKTPDNKKMKFEQEKTWETGKRLSTWYSNQQKRNY
jgi:hypothetical protein